MRDAEFYLHLLCLVKPWKLESIELSVEKLRVDVEGGSSDGGIVAVPAVGPSK